MRNSSHAAVVAMRVGRVRGMLSMENSRLERNIFDKI